MSDGLKTKGALAYRYGVTRLPDRLARPLLRREDRFDLASVPPPPARPDGRVRLYIGPANVAGQGYAWARAAERLDGVGAVSMQYREPGDLGFLSDDPVPSDVYRSSGGWARRQRAAVARDFTHVLVEASRQLFGPAFNGTGREISWLRDRGLSVGVAAHGSDLRLPSRHARLDEWSPFRSGDEWVGRLASKVRGIHTLLSSADVPVFVSTPDLLLDWPSAVWLPIVVDPATWASDELVLSRQRPVVLHAPTNPLVKGTALIEPTVERLAADGLLDYRRITGVPAHDMPALVSDADIVLEQFALGMYSVTAIEAMAAGRLVVGHVHQQVRDHVEAETGMRPPVVEATPATLDAVLRDILGDRDRFADLAAQGPAFVEAVHDGRLSARTLSTFLAVSPGGTSEADAGAPRSERSDRP